MTAATPTLNPQVLGRAENAHRALLDRILAGTGTTYEQWVALSLAAVSRRPIGREQLTDKMTGALKIDHAAARRAISALTNAHLLQALPTDSSRVRLTDSGQELHATLRADIDETIGQLYRDIPFDDLATAGRVLSDLTARADARLAEFDATDRERPVGS
jgi:DNA-binding MarR family transcriptional regulator